MHTSIAGGVHLSLERARELGCNTVQIFSHSPRTWITHQIPDDTIAKFKELRDGYNISPVFVHTSYLINLASPKKDIRSKSLGLLVREMDLADLLGADYVVIHTGSSSQDGQLAGRRRAIEALREVSERKKWKATLLLENTAGERGDISSRIEDLAEMLECTRSSLIGGICLDTCHAFQAGYDLTRKKGLATLAREIKSLMGFDRLKLIHLNDSKRDFNSGVDRHEHIGQGKIGRRGLKALLHHPAFMNIPLILETPKKTEGDDLRNLQIARALLRS